MATDQDRPAIPGAFCCLCGNTSLADLGRVTGICLDADACHRRQAERRRTMPPRAVAGPPLDLGDDPDGDNELVGAGGPVCEWCQRKAHGSCDGWIGEPDDPDTGACRCECRASENAAAGRREGSRP